MKSLFIVGTALLVMGQSVLAQVVPDWRTPKKFKTVAAHPRLFVSEKQLARAVEGRGDGYAGLYDKIAGAADKGLEETQAPMPDVSSFSRGFKIQGRLAAFAIQWHRTGERKYRDAALETMYAMEEWLEPGHDYFSLRHGQYIAGIAIAYDLLYNDMTPEERAKFVAFARDYCIRPFLRVTGEGGSPGERGSWWQDIVSNWNPVCNSGAGMLALAMYEDLDEAQTVIDRVDESFNPIIDYLHDTQGGWVEGMGYWNWTIHYMSLFYMSYERTGGVEHEGFRSEGFRKTLTFGSYFVPHAEACGFGDNQHGGVDSSVLAAAEHLGYDDVLMALQEYRDRNEAAKAHKERLRAERRGTVSKSATNDKQSIAPADISYGDAHRLLLEPNPMNGDVSEPVTNMVRSFPKQGWAMVADRWPEPNVYASVRGGVLGGPHTHVDLLSWHGVVGVERMILNYNKAGYYDTSWQQRAWEIYERSAHAKNTIFIGGLGPYPHRHSRGAPEAKIEEYVTAQGPAVRLDATRAYWLTRRNPKLVCRVLMAVGDKGVLVLDRIIGWGSNPVEVRVHTDKKATFGKQDVLLEGECETARLTFGCDRPAILREATAMLTDAQAEPPTVMRWQTERSVRDVTLASFLSRGSESVVVTVKVRGKSVTVELTGSGWSETVAFDDRLVPQE